MSMTLADLRKARNSDFGAITAALNKKSEYANDDEGYWKPERDKAGNATATIRFLPKHPDDDLPWVVLYTHAFQGPSGKWYIENCRSTINEQDPVNDLNRTAYKSGSEEDKKEAKARKRKTNYIARILVVSDPKHPENNGKVFKFKFGKKIFEKIMDKVQPTFEDEKPLNIFDPWDGADFKLRMRQVDGFPNYDNSAFESPSPIADSDEKILEIVNQGEALKGIIDPSKFKSYEDLEKKLKAVLNPSLMGGSRPSTATEAVERMAAEPSAPAPSAGKSKPAPAASSDDDDVENFFKNLANEE